MPTRCPRCAGAANRLGRQRRPAIAHRRDHGSAATCQRRIARLKGSGPADDPRPGWRHRPVAGTKPFENLTHAGGRAGPHLDACACAVNQLGRIGHRCLRERDDVPARQRSPDTARNGVQMSRLVATLEIRPRVFDEQGLRLHDRAEPARRVPNERGGRLTLPQGEGRSSRSPCCPNTSSMPPACSRSS